MIHLSISNQIFKTFKLTFKDQQIFSSLKTSNCLWNICWPLIEIKVNSLYLHINVWVTKIKKINIQVFFQTADIFLYFWAHSTTTFFSTYLMTTCSFNSVVAERSIKLNTTLLAQHKHHRKKLNTRKYKIYMISNNKTFIIKHSSSFILCEKFWHVLCLPLQVALWLLKYTPPSMTSKRADPSNPEL